MGLHLPLLSSRPLFQALATACLGRPLSTGQADSAAHAGTRWAATPAEEWPAVLAYARQHGARYLALDGWEAHLRPQLSFLLDPGQAPPELRHLATVAGEDPVVLYEILP